MAPPLIDFKNEINTINGNSQVVAVKNLTGFEISTITSEGQEALTFKGLSIWRQVPN